MPPTTSYCVDKGRHPEDSPMKKEQPTMTAADVVCSQPQPRITWIDSARSAGLLLVVFGHTLYSSSLTTLQQLIYSFHMPLFFLLSGFVCSDRDSTPFSSFFAKKARRLLLPYAAYSLISSAVSFFRYPGIRLREILLRFSFYYAKPLLLAPIWFLFTLFEILILERLLHIRQKKPVFQLASALAAFAAGGMLYLLRRRFILPFGIDKMLIGYGFFISGFLFRHIGLLRPEKDIRTMHPAYKLLVPLLTAAACIVFGVLLNGKTSMLNMKLYRYHWFVLSGLSGSCAVLCICRLLDPYLGKAFRRLSGYSILSLGTQLIWIAPYRRLMAHFGLSFSIWYDLLTILAVGIWLLVMTRLYDRITPRFPLLRVFNGEY